MDSHTTITTKTSKPLQAYRSSLTTSSPIESRTNLFIINNSIFISFFPLYFAKFGFFFGWCSAASARIGEVKRVTNETNVSVKFNLDGTGIADSTTGIPFLDHMLDRLSSHGLFDVHVRATGDIHIDDHHTNEDVALAIGTDLSGRPYLGYDLQIPTQRVGTYDTQLVEHFFQSLVNTSGMTLHIRQLAGRNSHHIIEATFKAFARALRQATEYDPRRLGTVPSSKGVHYPLGSQFSWHIVELFNIRRFSCPFHIILLVTRTLKHV
ncbi:imidazoleglycerol-phosphate dehydratase 1, chloroplastic isoform X5 [Populus trichocarpa]|uniref:imidazoleglycerol-phosphate dehydratase 1, chloroplastic isoform X5 n=1 Tax=Populus trichocarpa TaxID=3694 RepID=UPI000D187A7A|nr:imidazoleglycerol-phosphate dehydratase 1, chloroplastic isoform X5 [Populus trichocarpa]|eukprot:XP_024462010.1 imidazoleglycerol-phosphate dehydratase isoform X6 [Populus trichocarpa]